ncbi:MAG: hypothetical protein KGI25_06015 [Thaumarchaeota archaeon]|nr:hypothetical protein [Nitrososphaerota archaeon]
MSQMLNPRINRVNVLLFQDLYFSKKKAQVDSTVREVICEICDTSLDDGVSVTAKRIGQKMRFFCQYHLPKD